ncbi:MAG: hypothetical protein J0H14_02935 [Alphaproteobacteria bacterium]|nr:hypothetical protein [Alphaproteobacteria bacterium]
MDVTTTFSSSAAAKMASATSKMKPKRLAILFPVLFLAACPNPQPAVTITFHQVGACNGYVGGANGPQYAGANQAYLIFGITGINNSSGTSAFAFDPKRLFTNSSQRDYIDPGLQLSRDLFPATAVPITVAAGQNFQTNLSWMAPTIVQTANPDGAAEANSTPYNLYYNPQPTDPPILLVRTDGQRTSWPLTEDCRAITFQ